MKTRGQHLSKDLNKRAKQLANLRRGNKPETKSLEDIKKSLIVKYGKEYFKSEPKIEPIKKKNRKGYVFILLKSNSPYLSMINSFVNKSYLLEHRLVMAKHLGRCLESWEIVHHKNGIKDDNRIENLEIMTGYTHKDEHLNMLSLENRILKSEVKRLRKRIGLLEKEVEI